MCACHGTTICPDEIFLGYENDVPIYVRRDSQEGTAEIARRTAAPLPHPAEATGATIIDRINREAAEWRERALKAERELNEALAAGREALAAGRLLVEANTLHFDRAEKAAAETAALRALIARAVEAVDDKIAEAEAQCARHAPLGGINYLSWFGRLAGLKDARALAADLQVGEGI